MLSIFVLFVQFMLKNLLFSLFLLAVIGSVKGQVHSRYAGVTFRFDDYQEPAKLEKIRTVFKQYGFHFVHGVNPSNAYLYADSNAYWNLLRTLQAEGHELADQTPNDMTHFFKYHLPEEAAYFAAKPGVDHVNTLEKRVCLNYTINDFSGVGNESRVTIKDNMIISGKNGEWNAENTWGDNYFTHLYLPATNQVLGLAYFHSTVPSDPDTAFVRSFWGETISLNNATNVEYRKISPFDISIANDGVRLLAQYSQMLFAANQLKTPTVFLQPGNSTPYLSSKQVQEIYEAEYGYTCGNVYPLKQNTYLLSNPEGNNHFKIRGGDFTEEYNSVAEIIKLIADNSASHIVTVSLNHLSSWGGAAQIDDVVAKLQQILAFCKTHAIPVRTYSEVNADLNLSSVYSSENIFPSLSRDRDADGNPDGIVLGVGNYSPNGGPDNLPYLSGNTGGQLLRVPILGGLTKGWNQMSMKTKGGKNQWENIGMYMQLPEANMDLLRTFPADTPDWTTQTVWFYVPENVNVISIYLNLNAPLGSTIYVSDIRLNGYQSPQILAGRLARKANQAFPVLDLDSKVKSETYLPSTLTWEILNQGVSNTAEIRNRNLYVYPNNHFQTGEDQFLIRVFHPSDSLYADTAVISLVATEAVACKNCRQTLELLPSPDDSVYTWTSSPQSTIRYGALPYKIEVQPTAPTTFQLQITKKGGFMSSHAHQFRLNDPFEYPGGSKMLYFESAPALAIPLKASGLPNFYHTVAIHKNFNQHQAQFNNQNLMPDTLYILRNAGYSGFDNLELVFTSPSCDRLLFTIQTSTYPVGLEEQVAKKLQVFPNPFTDLLQVRGIENGSSFVVFDLNGRLIATGQVQNEELELKGLEPGMFALKIGEGYCRVMKN